MAQILELEGWVREELSLRPDDSVAISEKPGTDPRCSDVVTQVSITGPGRQADVFHIEQPLDALSRMDLIAALAFGGGH